MKLKTARTAAYCCIALVFVLGLILIFTQSKLVFALMMIGLAAELVIFFGFIRCPHCGAHLDRAGMNGGITFCPYCGKPLEEPEDGTEK